MRDHLKINIPGKAWRRQLFSMMIPFAHPVKCHESYNPILMKLCVWGGGGGLNPLFSLLPRDGVDISLSLVEVFPSSLLLELIVCT